MNDMKLAVTVALVITGAAFLFTACTGSIVDDETGETTGQTSITDLLATGSNGWNLGNTLDACSYGTKANLGLSTETSWGMPYTTQAMIQAVRQKGFTSIRIPVSWHNHIASVTGSGQEAVYTIDSAWISRVKQIVDWALAANLTVIINIHHDNLSESQMATTFGFCVGSSLSDTLKAQSKAYIRSVWAQISATFSGYGDSLIFELLNEPRAVGKPYEWDTGSYGTEVQAANALITQYEKLALDTIRASGGKNASRTVMVAPYAASPYMTSGWILPADSASGKLLVSVHAYTPYAFCMDSAATKTFTQSHKSDIDYLFNTLSSKWLSQGIGVVIGEMSASDKANTTERVAWTQYYATKARAAGIPVLLWDNMVRSKASGGSGDINSGECHGYFNRKALSWWF